MNRMQRIEKLIEKYSSRRDTIIETLGEKPKPPKNTRDMLGTERLTLDKVLRDLNLMLHYEAIDSAYENPFKRTGS